MVPGRISGSGGTVWDLCVDLLRLSVTVPSKWLKVIHKNFLPEVTENVNNLIGSVAVSALVKGEACCA
jgi:hypothetical protein